MEPTYGQIAEWLREAADDLESWGGYASDYFQEKWKLADNIQEVRDRAALVEAMGERRCGNCEHFIPAKINTWGPWRQCVNYNVYNQGPDFCCCHWKRREG